MGSFVGMPSPPESSHKEDGMEKRNSDIIHMSSGSAYDDPWIGLSQSICRVRRGETIAFIDRSEQDSKNYGQEAVQSVQWHRA